MKGLTVPAVTPRSAAEKAELNQCDSMDMYDHARSKQEYEAALRCALYSWNSGDHNWDDPDLATLVMIYANGDGVPRDVDTAVRLACEAQPADSAARLIHQLATSKSSASPLRFDICSLDIQTDPSTEYGCLASDLADQKSKRDAHLAELMARWTSPQRAAYEKAAKAYDAYASASAKAEGVIGTGYGEDMLQIQGDLDKEFAGDIEAFEQGKLPSATHQKYLDADKALNAGYKSLLANWDSDDRPAKDFLVNAERDWIVYRDAFVEFAKLRWPQVPADSWLAFLTEERTRRLR